MGRLFEGFQILCTDYDYILGKRGIVFKGGHYIREDIIQGNTVYQKKTNLEIKCILGVNNKHSFYLKVLQYF